MVNLEVKVGPQAESTLLAMSTLGRTLFKLDRLEEAETILRKPLQRVASPHHWLRKKAFCPILNFARIGGPAHRARVGGSRSISVL